jgi:hypothetical protein
MPNPVIKGQNAYTCLWGLAYYVHMHIGFVKICCQSEINAVFHNDVLPTELKHT